MRYKTIHPSFFIRNRKKISNLLDSNSLAIINSNDEMPRNGDQFFPFRQNSDLFYFTGIEQEKTILLLFPEHYNNEYCEILFLLKPTIEKEMWEGHKLTKEEARNISGIKNIMWLEEFEEMLQKLISFANYVYLNSNENKRFSTDVPYRDIRFMNELKSKYSSLSYIPLSNYIEKLRIIKEPEEIEIIKHACSITNKAFRTILNAINSGMYEYEIEAEIIREFIRNGANGAAYQSIVASGKNACVLHYITNDSICKNGDLVLLDFGAEYANYAADLSRTIPINGKFTKRQRQLYDATLRVMKEAIKMMVPGTTLNKIQEKVCRLWEKEHIALGLYTEENLQKQDKKNTLVNQYYMHSISHYMGLDVHDIGNKDEPLSAGMVVSCEPGIYIAKEEIGIRLETDILITDNEPIDLMKEIPIEADEIELLMSKRFSK